MRENISVREWQERFRAGDFDSRDLSTQCEAGWYDWFCQDHTLAGRLKKIGKVVMGITDPFILDNYYVWFKNNCPLDGPLYDDARFEPLVGERGGKYFLVALDSPHQRMKWALTTERFGFGTPEFECKNVREVIQYINELGPQLEQGKEDKAPQYDLSSTKALRASAKLARARADKEPNQDSYNAAWLHGYADALTEAARQMEPQKKKRRESHER